MDTSSPSFLIRVRELLPGLPPAQRHLADFVLDFPGDLASYSASELATLVNVSNATVSRFVKSLGYDSYDDARRSVRAEKQGGSPLYLASNMARGPINALPAHVEQGRENLTRTFQRIHETQLDEIARAMLGARKVWVVGFRTSHAFATYLRWQALQVIENIVVIPGAGETMGEHLASMAKSDCAIVFALRRRPAQMPAILAQIARSGARLLYVTDRQPEVEPAAAWHIRCDSAAPGPLDNHVAVIALCHLLATRAIELSGAAGRRRLTAIEVRHDALAEL